MIYYLRIIINTILFLGNNMKLEKLTSIIGHEEIGTAIFNIAGEKDIKEPVIAKHLFAIQDAELKDTFAKKYAKKLYRNIKSEEVDSKIKKQSLRLWKKFTPVFSEKKSELSEKTVNKITNISENFPQKIEKAEITQTQQTTSETPPRPPRPEGFQYDKFPEHTTKLRDLSEVAARLLEKTEEKVERKEEPIAGDVIIQEIKFRVKEDPAILQYTKEIALTHPGITSIHNPPFDHNYTGKNEGVFVNASDITFDEQNFILAGLVKSNAEAARYFDVLIARKVKVLASFHESTESASRCNNFWQNERLENMQLSDGWTIRNVEQKIIAKEELEPDSPCIVESTLIAKKGDEEHVMTHFHYDRWRDRHQMPSTDLMLILQDRMEELSPDPTVPIALNCRGGVGRSGSTAVAYLLRKRLQKELLQEKPIDEIEVNLPETVYEFRKQRSGVCGQGSQFAQVHEVLFKLYERYSKKDAQEDTSIAS